MKLPKFFFFIYRYLILPIGFLIFQIGRWLLPKNHKLSVLVQEKNSLLDHLPVSSSRPFWIHAASGEIEYARPVIRQLKEKFPAIPIVVTYSSPSAKNIISQMKEISTSCILPWDFPNSCQAFLKKLNPLCGLIARTDVWPEINFQARQNNIPLLLFSATFASNSSRLNFFSQHLTHFCLSQLKHIFVVSEADRKNLLDLNLDTPIEIVPDTRFEQIFHRLQNPRITKTKTFFSREQPILVCGSTWPEDEKVLLPALASAKNWKFIFAPHEIDEAHLQDLEARLQNLKLSSERYSKIDSWKSDVLIVDQIGILAEIYTWANAAFVGGSFRKQVHSVMEPLAAGVPVLVGPLHLNSREALNFQKIFVQNQPLVSVVRNSRDINLTLENFINLLYSKTEISDQLRPYQGGTRKVLAWVANQILSSTH